MPKTAKVIVGLLILAALAVSALILNWLRISEFPPAQTGVGNEARDTYVLVDDGGIGISLPSEIITRRGAYFENTVSGDIYYLFSADSCSERPPFTYRVKRFEVLTKQNFSVYTKDQRYATDGINVYFSDSLDYYSCNPEHKLSILSGADPKTFEPKIVTTFSISQGNTFQGLYSRDARNVFYGADLLEGVDAKSFRLSENVSITYDKNRVYLWNEILSEADPGSYVVVLDKSTGGRGMVYGKDKRNVFIDYCRLENVDPGTFMATWDSTSDSGGPFTVVRKEQTNCLVVRGSDSWPGSYRYSEAVKNDFQPVFWQYTLAILPLQDDANKYSVSIAIDGFQTSGRINALGTVENGVLEISFLSYAPDDTSDKSLIPGQVLLTLAPTLTGLKPTWQGLRLVSEINGIREENLAHDEVFKKSP